MGQFPPRYNSFKKANFLMHFVMIVKLLPDGQVQGRKQEEQHQEEQAH
jgi:hypothetical protein